MYEQFDLPREPPEQNPKYKPAKRTWWMPGDPDPMPLEPRSIDGGDIVPPVPARPVVPPPVAHNDPSAPTFPTTPTGRKARGELEYEVLAVCADFAADVFDWETCTPKLVAAEIGKREAKEPPSTGAINAVWQRWEQLGFASHNKKPLRFLFFNQPEHSASDLQSLKVKTRRAKRRSLTEAKRGVIRSQKRK